jgi:hypothetical protein
MWREIDVKERDTYFHLAWLVEEEHRKKYPGK